MAEYDGSIRIGTGIDTKEFKAGSKEIETEARRMAKIVSSSLGDSAKIALQKQTDAFVKLNQQYANQEQKVKDLGSKLHNMQRQKVETAEFKELSKDLDKAKASLDRLYDRRDSYVELGKKTPPKLELDISDAERKVRILEADIKELVYTNKAYVPVDTSKIKQEITVAEQKQMQMYTALQTSANALTSKIEQSVEKESERSNKLAEEVAEEERLAAIRENAVVGNQRIVEAVERRKQLLQEIADMEAAEIGPGYQQFDSAQQELASLNQEIKDYANSTAEMQNSYKTLGESVKQAFATMRKGIVDIPIAALKAGIKGVGTLITKTMVLPFKTFGNVAKKAISSIIPLLKRAASSMLGFGKSTKNSNSVLSGGLKNILRYGLGIRSLYALVNKLRTAITEGFTNMANEVDGFKSKVDSLQGSTLTLKNSFAAAFRPLVEVAIPYIQMVVDAVSNLLDMIGQFTAAITGQKTYTKAIKQTTAAIEDENKAQNKQLSGLDKLNNLSSGSGGSVDSGASTQMFEEDVPISSRFEDIAQQLKDMWKNADFSDLGKVLGDKLKSALKNIPWDSIKQTVSNAGKSFGTLINGIAEVPDLALDIGKTIGEAINTGITGINSFLDNTNWDSVGVFIGEALNSLVDAISWEDIGHFFAAKFNAIFESIGEAARKFNWINFGLELSNGFNTFISDFDWAENGARLGDLVKNALDAIITFLENTNWKELGNNVADFIGSIDWTGVISRLFEGLGAALGGLAAFLWGLIEDAWNSVVEWWNEVAFEDGKFTIKGLLNGILHVLVNIDNWIRDNIFLPIWNGIKNAFGIHSPSTVMSEMGVFLIQGLLNGISSLVEKVILQFTNIKDKVISVWNSLKTKTTEIWSGIKNAIKSPINSIISSMEFLVNSVINGINFVIRALNGISFDIPEWLKYVPGASILAGKTFGFNIPEIKEISIPRLATGTVVPPNNEFLAVLGDNKREPEIVSPISTMKQAFKEVLSEASGAGSEKEINLYLSVECEGYQLINLFQKLDKEYFKQTGRHVLA